MIPLKKRITFCRLKVRSCMMIANISGSLKAAPLRILRFPAALPHKFSDAEKSHLQFAISLGMGNNYCFDGITRERRCCDLLCSKRNHAAF